MVVSEPWPRPLAAMDAMKLNCEACRAPVNDSNGLLMSCGHVLCLECMTPSICGKCGVKAQGRSLGGLPSQYKVCMAAGIQKAVSFQVDYYSRNYSSALEEINMLKRRVSQLEGELERERELGSAKRISIGNPGRISTPGGNTSFTSEVNTATSMSPGYVRKSTIVGSPKVTSSVSRAASPGFMRPQPPAFNQSSTPAHRRQGSLQPQTPSRVPLAPIQQGPTPCSAAPGSALGTSNQMRPQSANAARVAERFGSMAPNTPRGPTLSSSKGLLQFPASTPRVPLTPRENGGRLLQGTPSLLGQKRMLPRKDEHGTGLFQGQATPQVQRGFARRPGDLKR